FRFAILVPGDGSGDRLDLKGGPDRGDSQLVLHCLLSLRSALRGSDTLAQLKFEEIFLLRQSHVRAAQIGDALMQAISEGEMRRRIVRRKNCRSADHQQLEMSI